MKEKNSPVASEAEEEKERREIAQKYRALLRKIRASGREHIDKKKIRKAFDFAAEAHKDMRRLSGEPYVYHPLEVACICVSELGLGTTSVVSALLHDVVEDTDIKLPEIEKEFGTKVAAIIHGLTKIKQAVKGVEASEQSQTFRRILLSLVKDVRVILVKMADRLHNMRTLTSLPRYKQIRVVSETIYLYAPLAHRLGLHRIKSEMEDYYLKYTDIASYRSIAGKLKRTKRKREQIMKKLTEPIQELLEREGIAAEVRGRTKSIYSIWNKMKGQNVPFEEVYDLYAVRVILKEEHDLQRERALCWRIYALITGLYTPNASRIRDWISTPKGNGYEALHLTVMAPYGEWVEVQIRSQRMNEIAENGVAAHWRYKGSREKTEEALDQRIIKIRDFIENKEVLDSPEFVRDFHAEILTDEIYVFTPKGACKTLPIGASVLDFAYEIHSEMGARCAGARVNKKLMPYNYVLQNGDQVDVVAAEGQQPKEEWLGHVVTSKAKEKIRQFLRAQRRELARAGKEILLDRGDNGSKVKIRTLEEVSSLLYLTIEDLCYEVGRGSIKAEKVFEIINKNGRECGDTAKRKWVSAPSSGASSLRYQNAPCCNPIPGDEVFGLVSEDGAVRMHRTSCPHAPELLSQHGKSVLRDVRPYRLDKGTQSTVRMRGIDQHGITEKILNTVGRDLDITYIHLEAEAGIFTGEIKVRATDAEQLNQLIEKIKKVEGVVTVLRTYS